MEGDHWIDLVVDGKIIPKLILKEGCVRALTRFIRLGIRVQWRDIVRTIRNLRVP
jgi:hypothetical protein